MSHHAGCTLIAEVSFHQNLRPIRLVDQKSRMILWYNAPSCHCATSTAVEIPACETLAIALDETVDNRDFCRVMKH
jgi:hypothetical protein